MKIKSTISTFMHKFFAEVAFIGFFIMCSASDISDEGLTTFVWCCVIWMSCVGLAYFFYNPSNVTRYIFAGYCVFLILHGYIHHRMTAGYRKMYDALIDSGSFRKFYLQVADNPSFYKWEFFHRVSR